MAKRKRNSSVVQRFWFDSKAGKIVEGPAPTRAQLARWPIHSESMAVHPSQREELRRHLEECGVPTEIDADGCPVLTGPEHRRMVAEARGFYDRNGGYSDPQRR